MAKELYVGSLSYDTTEYDLEKLFSVSGRVTSVHLILDNKTGRFMGCGYVRMSTEAEAKDAVASLDGALLIDRKITVSIARPQKQKGQGSSYKGKNPDPAKAGGKAARPSSGVKAAAGKPAAAKAGTAKPAAKPAAKAAAKPAMKPAARLAAAKSRPGTPRKG